MNRKKWRLFAALMLISSLLIAAACGSAGGNREAQTAGADGGNPQSTEKVKINFYGEIPDWASTQEMFAKAKELLGDRYEINAIQVDFSNLQKVVKTGIASGTPADIYLYWPQNMQTFIEVGQALDLTPYLEENDGEWKKTFNPSLLDIGKYDGKYYNVPISSNFSALYVNKALFEEAGLEIPTEWTWDEFMEVNKAIKEKTDAFPFAIHRLLNNWLYRNGVLSLSKQQGKLEQAAAGEVPADDPIFIEPLKKIKELYDNEYWYPGKGALTLTKEEALSAFLNGKAAILAEVATDALKILEEGETNGIEVVTVPWPAMGEYAILGGADGYFIPSNAPNPDAAVEVLKTFLSKEVQQIHADKGYPSASAEVEFRHQVQQDLADMMSGVYPHEFISVSPKIFDYILNEITADYVLGGKTEEQIAEHLEMLRKEAVES